MDEPESKPVGADFRPEIPETKVVFLNGAFVRTAGVPQGAVEVSEDVARTLQLQMLRGKQLRVVGSQVQAVQEDAGPSALPPEAQLQFLDAALPRVLEDTWAAIPGFDVRSLPEAVQRKLRLKQQLRQQVRKAGA